MPRYFGMKGGGRKPSKPSRTDVLQEMVRNQRKKEGDYRTRSLAIHGWICAKCGREFDRSNLHLLTVHHKDGNPHNNPPDGSNWENLCAYCHEDEHSRGVLADYLRGEEGS
ncbi:MAG: HNH nuclease family protein [Deltaproteobacteria bacterium]|nr:HNH nuclease family protein [Deltaproteobacteria bacterium]MBW2306990.1 HNH nuclease family protein [Deltaproteobacteria bacterium]